MVAPKVSIVSDWNPSGVKAAQRDIGIMEKQAKGFGSSVTGSFAGIGAAIGGAFAATAVIDFFKQSAQAAMDDQKSMIALATAMENVGLAAKTAEAEGLINSMSMQFGIADDKLRPAFQKLATATRDVGKAQGLLQTAMDLSAAGYGDLEGASKALSAAAMGNFTALQRLKVPIDANIIKAKDFEGAMKALNSVVGGQATAAAASYQGQMDRLTVAVGEAQEAIGYALLDAVDNLIGKMGGTDGLQGMILETGNEIASMINDVSDLADGIDELARGMIALSTLGLVQVGEGFSFVGRMLTALIGTAKQWIMGPLPVLLDGLKALGFISEDTTDAQKAQTSATVQAALASGKAAPVINDLTEEVQKSGLAAYTSAQSFTAFWTAAANLSKQQAITRELLNTSGTVGAELFAKAQDDLAKAEANAAKSAKDGARSLDGLKTSSGGATTATKELTAAQQAAADRAKALEQNTDSLATALQGMAQEISPTIASAATATFDSVNAQIEKFKSMFQEAKQYAQGIVDGFMGQLDLGKALDSAKETGKTIVEAFVDQGKGIVEFGRKMKSLMDQGLSRAAYDDIIKLGYERGMDVAKALSEGNVAGNIASVNEVYGSVKTMAEEVAEAAASAFYDAGLKSMMELVRAMVEALSVDGKGRKKIMKILDDLAEAMYRKSYIDVEVRGPYSTPEFNAAMASYDGPTFSPSNPLDLSAIGQGVVIGGPGFADGGIATSPTPGIFGEAGPEALIPLDRLGDFGGNTYSITVNAGVGDPRAIGKSVVEAITLFERSSGPVFARA